VEHDTVKNLMPGSSQRRAYKVPTGPFSEKKKIYLGKESEAELILTGRGTIAD